MPHPNSLANLTPGRSPTYSTPKRVKSVTLSEELIEAIANLPQVKSKEWSFSYACEMLLRNRLEMPADYDDGDIALVLKGAILA